MSLIVFFVFKNIRRGNTGRVGSFIYPSRPSKILKYLQAMKRAQKLTRQKQVKTVKQNKLLFAVHAESHALHTQ